MNVCKMNVVNNEQMLIESIKEWANEQMYNWINKCTVEIPKFTIEWINIQVILWLNDHKYMYKWMSK